GPGIDAPLLVFQTEQNHQNGDDHPRHQENHRELSDRQQRHMDQFRNHLPTGNVQLVSQEVAEQENRRRQARRHTHRHHDRQDNDTDHDQGPGSHQSDKTEEDGQETEDGNGEGIVPAQLRRQLHDRFGDPRFRDDLPQNGREEDGENGFAQEEDPLPENLIVDLLQGNPRRQGKGQTHQRQGDHSRNLSQHHEQSEDYENRQDEQSRHPSTPLLRFILRRSFGNSHPSR